MTISELRAWATGEKHLPVSETLMLLAHVLNLPKEEIITGDGAKVSEEQNAAFTVLVERRSAGTPMAYLRNTKEFYGIPFYVDERVLIPRPETELVIDTVKDLYTDLSEPHTVADIGTGSGAIALTLARHLPQAHVHAVDISQDALAVTQKNRSLQGLNDRVTLHYGDLLTPLITASVAPKVIVANLPYISLDDVANVEPAVHAYEPHLALYSGKIGLEHYQRMFSQLADFPQLPRHIVGEFGFGQSEALKILLKNMSHLATADLTIFPDLAGIPRVFLISL